MDDWSLEREANELSVALSDLRDYTRTVSKLIEVIETFEKEKEDYLKHCSELEDTIGELRENVYDLRKTVAEVLNEKLIHLETIKSLHDELDTQRNRI